MRISTVSPKRTFIHYDEGSVIRATNDFKKSRIRVIFKTLSLRHPFCIDSSNDLQHRYWGVKILWFVLIFEERYTKEELRTFRKLKRGDDTVKWVNG